MVKSSRVRTYLMDNFFKYLIPIFLALLCGTVLILWFNESPFEVYKFLFWGAFIGKGNLARTFRWATPLIFSGLVVALAYNSGMLNMGGEGQIYVGAFAAAIVGLLHLPPPVHLPLTLLVAALAGGVFALIPAFLKVFYRIDEIVTTLMLNYIAVLLTDYLVLTIFFPPGTVHLAEVATPPIAKSAMLPRLIPPYQLNTGLFLALFIAVLFYYFQKKTTLGYETEVVGLNRSFARYGGINDIRNSFLIFVLSGMIAGLCGGVEVQGAYLRFVSGSCRDLGYDGILVALLGRCHPLGVVVAAIFFGALKNGFLAVSRVTNVDSNMATVLQALVILFFTSEYMLSFIKFRKKESQNVN